MPRAAPVTWNTAIKVIRINQERNFSVWKNYLDELDELAAHIGSINCIHSYNGILRGYNSDYSPFLLRYLFFKSSNLINFDLSFFLSLEKDLLIA